MSQETARTIQRGHLRLLKFPETDTVTDETTRPFLTSTAPGVIRSSGRDIARALTAADTLLRSQLNRPGTTFFNQTAEQQGAFLRAVIDLVDVVLPASDLVIMTGDILSSVYLRDKNSGKIFDTVRIDPGADVSFMAEMPGATLVDVAQNGFDKQYYEPTEMASFATGLCVTLDPLEVAGLDLSRRDDPDLIVSWRGIRDPHIEIV